MKKKNDIRCIARKDVNIEAYDLCIASSLHSLPYAFSFYLDAICEDWLVLVEGSYARVMPLPIRTKLGITYSYPPFFMQQLGVFSKDLITATIVQQFLEHIPTHIKFVETNLNYANVGVEGSAGRMNLVLSLEKKYDQLFESFSKTLKRNILNANKNKALAFSETEDIEKFVSFFKTYAWPKSKNINPLDIKKLTHLIAVLLAKKLAKIFFVEDEKGWLSAALFLTTNTRLINLVPVNNEEAKDLNTSAFLLNKVIEKYAERAVLLDFEGSEIPGVARFYRQFGAEEQCYFRYKENRLPLLLKWLKP